MKKKDFFERAYVINLPSRTDRRRAMERELRRAGLPLASGKVEIFPAIRPDDPGPFPSIGIRGCYESHVSILRQAREQGWRNVLIMEDDLTIADRYRDAEDRLMAQLAGLDWDFVYFGHTLELSPADGAPVLQPFPGPIVTAHFYGINARVLGPLLEALDLMRTRPPGHPDGGPMHIDAAYTTFRAQHPEVITLVANPNLGWQRSSRSDIHASRWFDRTPGFRELVNWLRAGRGKLRGH